MPYSSKSIDPGAQGSHGFFWGLVSASSESVRLELLAQHFGSIKALEEASIEELRTIDEVGPKIAQAIAEFFAVKDES